MNADHEQYQHIKKIQSAMSVTKYHPGSDMFFAHLFTLFQAIVSVFKIALLQIWTNLNHTNKTQVNVANFKQFLSE